MPYKILYIDDQSDTIDLVRLALRCVGCEVYGATDGLEGVHMMHELRPDLVLLDLMLPGWDGWKVRAAMQADAELRAMPVVLVTARVVLTSTAGPQPPPADAYITKPFSVAEIRKTVQTVLFRHSNLSRVLS